MGLFLSGRLSTIYICDVQERVEEDAGTGWGCYSNAAGHSMGQHFCGEEWLIHQHTQMFFWWKSLYNY